MSNVDFLNLILFEFSIMSLSHATRVLFPSHVCMFITFVKCPGAVRAEQSLGQPPSTGLACVSHHCRSLYHPTLKAGLLPSLTCTQLQPGTLPTRCWRGAHPPAGFSPGQGHACFHSQQKTRCSSQFFPNLKVNTKLGHISYPTPQLF